MPQSAVHSKVTISYFLNILCSKYSAIAHGDSVCTAFEGSTVSQKHDVSLVDLCMQGCRWPLSKRHMTCWSRF